MNLKNKHVNFIVYNIRRTKLKVVFFITSGVANWLKYHPLYAPDDIVYKIHEVSWKKSVTTNAATDIFKI